MLKSPEMFEDDSAPAEPKPRLWKVVGLLVIAAAIFSYMGAYSVTDALAKVSVIRAIPKDHDPRPLWAAIGFVTFMTLFLVGAIVMRHLSSRQFQRIDQMLEEDPA